MENELPLCWCSVCSHEFAFSLFCQNQSYDKRDADDDSLICKSWELTKEQIQEFERESYENWIDARKQER